jgi:hypothetical protein
MKECTGILERLLTVKTLSKTRFTSHRANSRHAIVFELSIAQALIHLVLFSAYREPAYVFKCSVQLLRYVICRTVIHVRVSVCDDKTAGTDNR